MNWFKKKELTRLEQLNTMIAVIEKEDRLNEWTGADSGRDLKYVFNPTITVNCPDAFTLNAASAPIVTDRSNYYVNRVLIPRDITRAELRKVMIDMKCNYQYSNFRTKNRVVTVQFGYPTPKGMEYIREGETPSFYEIRLSAKGYNLES